MIPLPIDPYLPQIAQRLKEAGSLVLVAPPGAGKTTRVPPAILAAKLLSPQHPNLVMLQPRRVAARASAMRIAEENGWRLGEQVGYHVRFDRAIGPQTRLRVLTEGILNRQLLADPLLEGVGCVILDEFHERSLHTDLALAMLREVKQTVRPDLLIVVMSATLHAQPVAAYLGDCPIVQTEGRTYPVDIAYLPHAALSPQLLPDQVAEAVTGATIQDGDVLVFLPGVEEIRRCMERLESAAGARNLLLVPLHGTLTAEEQMAALRPASRRKVILATNIAETSLTIEGVRTVIDSGLARVASYDPARGMDRLELKRISRASATQRAGRAGRTAPGRCFRLWSEAQDRALEDFELPEVQRVDLAATVLALLAWGHKDPRAFPWFEAPAETALAAAQGLLVMLGAVSLDASTITPIGKRMLKLPVHPRLSRLLLEAAGAGLLETGATIAALLSEKDVLRPRRTDRHAIARSTTRSRSDLLYRLDLLSGHTTSQDVDRGALRHVARTRDQLLRIARNIGGHSTNTPDEDAILQLPLCAYPDRVCRRRGADHASAVMVGGGGVRLSPDSVVHDAELFLALDARHDERSAAREAMVRIASEVQPQWLGKFFPHLVEQRRTAVFDEQRQRVTGRIATCFADLLLEEREGAVDPQQAGAVLADALRPRTAELFAANEAATNLLRRVTFLRRHMPQQPWPAFDSDELGALVAELCAGRTSVSEVDSGLVNILRAQLKYPLDRLLDEHAPESIQVPSGSRIRIDYAPRNPVLAVRLQEVFGWQQTPRLADGRVPLTLHLLGPNFRPVQVTDDLRSFWSNTYFQVRKDLRARYPKHSWPENPLSAAPEAKGRRSR